MDFWKIRCKASRKAKINEIDNEKNSQRKLSRSFLKVLISKDLADTQRKKQFLLKLLVEKKRGLLKESVFKKECNLV